MPLLVLRSYQCTLFLKQCLRSDLSQITQKTELTLPQKCWKSSDTSRNDAAAASLRKPFAKCHMHVKLSDPQHNEVMHPLYINAKLAIVLWIWVTHLEPSLVWFQASENQIFPFARVAERLVEGEAASAKAKLCRLLVMCLQVMHSRVALHLIIQR